MRFQVKTLMGKTIDMDLDRQETVGEIKNRLQLIEGKEVTDHPYRGRSIHYSYSYSSYLSLLEEPHETSND